MISCNGEWHTQEMKRVSKLPCDQLLFTRKDCLEAMIANPDNPKNGQYADTAHYCGMELAKIRQNKATASVSSSRVVGRQAPTALT